MPRVNVYLPDELAKAARPLGLNLSQVLQTALQERLESVRLDAWLGQLDTPAEVGRSHGATRVGLEAIEREERERRG